MNGWLTKAGLAAGVVATALAAAAPAEAQRWHRHRGRGGDPAAAALIGGVVGLAAGAAIANSGRDRYWDRGYYDNRYYAPPPRYYRDRYYGPPRGYYRNWGPPRGYYRDWGPPRGYYGGGYYGW